jgi:hypothetical protein
MDEVWILCKQTCCMHPKVWMYRGIEGQRFGDIRMRAGVGYGSRTKCKYRNAI